MTSLRSLSVIFLLLLSVSLASNTHRHRHHRHHRRHVPIDPNEILPLPDDIEFMKEWVTEPIEIKQTDKKITEDCLLMLFFYSLHGCDGVVCKKFEKLAEVCRGKKFNRLEMIQICCPANSQNRKNSLEFI
ncbi:unnamed protein product [Caenorhabditis brenneri]